MKKMLPYVFTIFFPLYGYKNCTDTRLCIYFCGWTCMSVDDIYIWDFYRFRVLRLCIHFFERTGRSICCDAMSRGGYSGKDRNGRLLRFAVCLLPGCCQFDYHVQESKS